MTSRTYTRLRTRSLVLILATALTVVAATAAAPLTPAEAAAIAERASVARKLLPTVFTPVGTLSSDGDAVAISTRYTGFTFRPLGVSDAGARVTGEVFLPPRATLSLYFALPAETTNPIREGGSLRLALAADKEGNSVQLSGYDYDTTGPKPRWTPDKKSRQSLVIWPSDAKIQKRLADAGIERPAALASGWVPFILEIGRDSVDVSLAGQALTHLVRTGVANDVTLFAADIGVKLRHLEVSAPPTDDTYVPVDLRHLTGAQELTAPTASTTIDGIPFMLPTSGAMLDLSTATWVDEKADPSSYNEPYDGGPMFFGDKRMPFVTIPAADYATAYMLLRAAPDLAHNVMTLRVGHYGYTGRTFQHDIAVGLPFGEPGVAGAPAAGVLGTDGGSFQTVETSMGRLYLVRQPILLPLDSEVDDHVDVEITKSVALARRAPDPNRFRFRPVGLSSQVQLAAITFERSPVQMRLEWPHAGHVWTVGQNEPVTVVLENRTARPVEVQTGLTLSDEAGTPAMPVAGGERITVPGHGRVAYALVLPTAEPTFKRLAFAIFAAPSTGADAGGAAPASRPLLVARTTYAVLPPDTRTHHADNPFGTWDFSGGHDTSADADFVGALHQVLGLRYGMFGFTAEERARYQVRQGREPLISAAKKGSNPPEPIGVAMFESFREGSPDAPLVGMIFHENAISGPHVSRVPDLFTDRPAYKLNADEQKRFDDLVIPAIANARALRAKYPDVKITLGNGTLPMKEELYRQGFPGELFDSAGNESGSFGRLPEAQPPDYVANNASIWMDRQMLDHYGFKDKPVTQCFEITYPCTNPGNLSEMTQADYFVRHALHALSWQIPLIRMGTIMDMGNSYRFSNWGSSGFFTRMPDPAPKPAAVALATMIRVLDGATVADQPDLGDGSLYAVHFTRADGRQVYALWTIRGERTLQATLPGNVADWQVVNWLAHTTTPAAAGGDAPAGTVALTLSGSPIWLVGPAPVNAFRAVPPAPAAASGEVTPLGSLADLTAWSVEPGRDVELETHNFMSPRRKGDFAITDEASFDGVDQVLKVEPRPLTTGKDTMPMYTVLRHATGLPISDPGATAIVARINGNAGWGRLIYELIDARGERWISIGASQRGEVSPWLLDWMPKEFQNAKSEAPADAAVDTGTAAVATTPTLTMGDWNTDDLFGFSRINFTGWRWVAFPLPGNYSGDYKWPANSQWKWDGDGIVDLPLTLHRVAIELPEKVLHVKSWEPPSRAAIYVRDLGTTSTPIIAP